MKVVTTPERGSADRVLVHADGGDCHGTALVRGRCPRCGIAPDTQSTELWRKQDVKR